MEDERLMNMLAKFSWGIRVEPGHPYKHPPNGRRLQINHVWLADAATTQEDTLLYCTIGDRAPLLICRLKSCDPVQTSWNFQQETEQVIFSVFGPGGVYLAGSYIQDLVRECQISAKGRRVFRKKNFVLIGGEKKRNGRRRLKKKYLSIAEADIERENKDMSIDDADIDGEKKRNGKRRVVLTLGELLMWRSIERRREIVGPQLIKKDSLNKSIDMSGADKLLQALEELPTNKETEAEFGAVWDVPYMYS